jgi:type IV pilus assembly protein PilX
MLKVRAFKSSQRGVTLFLAMIVLVAMLLSGIALFRTVDSGVLVAGNIAMQKSATRQGDQGTEDAIAWLVANAGTTALHEDSNNVGYVDYPFYAANAVNDTPGTNQTWAEWWDVYIVSHSPVALPVDSATGNTVTYLIQRLCSANGAPYSSGVSCIGPPQTTNTGGSKGAGVVALQRASAVYYRITSRIVGPRNTVSFVQTVIAL